jgi:hypothetical protein
VIARKENMIVIDFIIKIWEEWHISTGRKRLGMKK